jgi:pantoate kinase
VAKGVAHDAMGIKANGKSRHGGFSVTAIRKIKPRDVQIRQLFSAPKACGALYAFRTNSGSLAIFAAMAARS